MPAADRGASAGSAMTMQIPLYQIDAFTDRLFGGNPAAVCPLREWIADDVMQAIAAENNLSDTGFFVETGNGFHIRWFTPQREVDLCGHATLAAAHLIFNVLGYEKNVIHFGSNSGRLTVTRRVDLLEMDFPAQPPSPCELPPALEDEFGGHVIACLRAEDYIVVLDSEQAIATAAPDLLRLRALDLRGVIITARTGAADFALRFFAPKYGIDEDPVTGSAFTQLVPYWAKELGKTTLHARQLSRRGGEVLCALAAERVILSGTAVLYSTGSIEI